MPQPHGFRGREATALMIKLWSIMSNASLNFNIFAPTNYFFLSHPIGQSSVVGWTPWIRLQHFTFQVTYSRAKAVCDMSSPLQVLYKCLQSCSSINFLSNSKHIFLTSNFVLLFSLHYHSSSLIRWVLYPATEHFSIWRTPNNIRCT